ncbi:MAG: hypothetical protein EZS28_037321, partial [Streblomastix strix]
MKQKTKNITAPITRRIAKTIRKIAQPGILD